MKTLRSVPVMLMALLVLCTINGHAQTPTISSFVPASGPIGTSVTITGTNFDATPSNNVVYFGATRGAVTAATGTSLTVTVPVGATFNPISIAVGGQMAFSAKPFVVTFTSGWPSDLVSFDSKVDFSISGNSGGVVLQDFDGDGKADVAVADLGSNVVSVFRNIGSSGSITPSTFGAKVDFPTGGAPMSLTTGDFDGDGKMDLAWAKGAGAFKVCILRNISTPGSILFAAYTEYSSAWSFTRLTAGDIDVDGHCDLIGDGNGAVTILRNTGGGGAIAFADGIVFPGSIYYDVALGDIDGDGKVDIILAWEYGWIGARVFGNQSTPGSLSFAPSVDIYFGGAVPYGGGRPSAAVGDLDGDGKADIAVSNTASGDIGQVSVLHNTSTPGAISCDPVVIYSVGVNTFPSGIALTDINGDGKLDITLSDNNYYGIGTVSVLRNTSTPGVINSSSLAAKVDFGVGAAANDVEVGDIDGDGVPDIVTSNYNGNSFSVLRNKLGDPPPPRITSFTPTSGPIGTVVTISGVGFDATPSNNVVYFGATRGTVTGAASTLLTMTVPVGATYKPISVAVNGQMAYSTKPFVVTFTSGWPSDLVSFDSKVDFSISGNSGGVVLQDFDGDGKADVAVADLGSNVVSVFRNIGSSGSITPSTFGAKVDFPTGGAPMSLTTGDFDGDGKMDLAWAKGAGAFKVCILRNISTPGSILFAAYTEYSSAWSFTRLTAGDIDVDGHCDLIGDGNGAVTILRNTGGGGAIAFADGIVFPGSVYYDVALGDIDGDGKVDIILAWEYGWIGARVFGNQSTPGSLSFAPSVDIYFGGAVPYGGGRPSAAVGDLDGDGKADIAVSNTASGDIGQVSVLHNTSTPGAISCDPVVIYSVGVNTFPSGIALTDINGDGKLDITLSDNNYYGIGTVSVLRNTSTPGVINSSSLAAKVDFGVGAAANDVEVGDIDGDGVPDIVTSNYNGNSFSVLRNMLGIVITASATSGGTLTPSGAMTVPLNSNKTFTMLPDGGYMVASVLVDGAEQGHLTSYTFNSITANHTIAVTFRVIPMDVYVDAIYTPGSAGGNIFGYDGFNTVQLAIDILAVGGRVHVAAGIYNEVVAANKVMSLLGAGSATTTIKAGGSLNDGVTISASGVTMSGFTVTNSQNGVVVLADKATIKSCAFTSYSQNGVKVLNKDYAFIQNNHFTGAAGTSGILLSGAQQCAVSGNAITGNNVNVMVVASTSPVRSARNNSIRSNTLLNPGLWSVVSDPVLNKVNFNVFSTVGTSNKYVQNTSATVVLNAEYNWFGGENPPNGSDFSGNVDTTHYFATNPTIFIDPMSHYIPVGSPVVVTVSGMLPAGTYAKGSSVTLNWSNDASMPDVTVPVDGGFFDDGVGPVFFAFNPLTGSSVKVDQSLLNNTPPGGVGEPALFPYPYIGDLFSMTFQPGGAGASTITLSSTLVRSSDNTPLTVDIGPAAVLTADAEIPTVTNVVIHNQTLNTDDPSVNGTGQDDYVKNGDIVRVTADIDDDNPLTTLDMVADLTPFGGGSSVNPTSFDDGTHAVYWDFSPLAGTGNSTLTIPVTVTDVVYNSATASDNITSDNIAPTPPTGFVSKTDNTTGGHEKVALNWTGGTDAHYKSAVIRYNTWSYPTYPAGSTPVYPANALDGTGITFTPVNAISAVHSISARNIYYYGAFTVDWAGNCSAATTAEQQDRSANYFPGDLGSGANPYPGTAYDGRVNFDDLVWFSNFYFANSPFVNNGGEVDFGPTSSNKTYGANHRLGIPTPDGHVDFEDLMIFSMNYLNTTPKITEPSDRQLAQTFAVELYNTRSTTQQGEMLTVTLHLANDGRQVKGCSVELSFDPLLLQYVDANPAGLFGSSQQGFFYAQSEQNKVRVDASVLGVDRTVDFSGNIAVVRFRVLQAGQGQATIANATVRNDDNNSQQPVLNSNAVPLPTVFSLAQNYPNPFNPSTSIKYQIPSTNRVTVVVYNVLGERVATLVDEVKEAGYYNVEWNGRNAGNQQVASGLYIYTMRAGEFRNVKKMLLLK